MAYHHEFNLTNNSQENYSESNSINNKQKEKGSREIARDNFLRDLMSKGEYSRLTLSAEQAALQAKYREVEELIELFPKELKNQYEKWRNDPDRGKGKPQDQFYRLGEILKDLSNQFTESTGEVREKVDGVLKVFDRNRTPKSAEQDSENNTVPSISISHENADFNASSDLGSDNLNTTKSSKKRWSPFERKKQKKGMADVKYDEELENINREARREKEECMGSYIFVRKDYDRTRKNLIDQMSKVIPKEEEEILTNSAGFKEVRAYIEEEIINSMRNVSPKLFENQTFKFFITLSKDILEKEMWQRHKIGWAIWNLQKQGIIEGVKKISQGHG